MYCYVTVPPRRAGEKRRGAFHARPVAVMTARWMRNRIRCVAFDFPGRAAWAAMSKRFLRSEPFPCHGGKAETDGFCCLSARRGHPREQGKKSTMPAYLTNGYGGRTSREVSDTGERRPFVSTRRGETYLLQDPQQVILSSSLMAQI
jgi:hypothetical protein